MEDSDLSGTGGFPTNPRVRITCGETLPNGTIIDLVAAADRDGLDLLSWDGKESPVVAPAIICGGTIYHHRRSIQPSGKPSGFHGKSIATFSGGQDFSESRLTETKR